jgi:hypothetical protein
MKIILLGFVTMAALASAVVAKFPQVANQIPGVARASNLAVSIERSETFGQAREASGDLVQMISSGQIGLWHFVIIGIGVLLARKVLMWVLR